MKKVMNNIEVSKTTVNKSNKKNVCNFISSECRINGGGNFVVRIFFKKKLGGGKLEIMRVDNK